MPTPRLEPKTVKVGQLVDDYRSGRIAIPEFQRDYVWKKRLAPLLIDSLYKNFPISSLLFWQSAESPKARRSSRKLSRGRMTWLIDGQQRVMTLDRVIHADEDDGIDVLFNSETKEFNLANAAIRSDPRWVRLAQLFDDKSYRELRQDISAQLEELYDRVRDTIRNYEIPVVQMVNHSFDDAVKAFIRINSLGSGLKGADIASARAAAKHSGFIADEVVPFMDELETLGLRRLTVMHLFKACAFIAMPDGRTVKPLHELDTQEVLKAWKRTERATREAHGIVRAELGLLNMDILWSGALLVPLIAMSASARPGKSDPKGMVGWLALATMLHRYSKGSATALDQDLRACRDDDPIGPLLTNLRQYQRNSLSATPADFAQTLNDRSGLLATYVACKNRGMMDLFSGGKVAMRADINRHHILPRRQFDEDRAKADKIANIAFITGEVNKKISHSGPETYLKDIEPAILTSQCIPLDPALWHIEEADKFYAARRALLAESFNEFVREALPGRHL
jgi:hypothetical protein